LKQPGVADFEMREPIVFIGAKTLSIIAEVYGSQLDSKHEPCRSLLSDVTRRMVT